MSGPFDRSAAIARVGFLMPGLTDGGLAELLRCAEVMGRHHARDLTPATLAAEQREREAMGEAASECTGIPPCGVPGCDIMHG